MLTSVTKYPHETTCTGSDLTDEEKLLVENYSFVLDNNRQYHLELFLKYIEDSFDNPNVSALVKIVNEQNNILPLREQNAVNFKKEFIEDGEVINKYNISKYYSKLKYDDFEHVGSIIDDIFEDRIEIIIEKLNLSRIEASKYINPEHYESYMNDFVIELKIFNTKDNLQPIDDLINEIKNSEEYKTFIKTNLINKISDLAKKIPQTDLDTTNLIKTIETNDINSEEIQNIMSDLSYNKHDELYFAIEELYTLKTTQTDEELVASLNKFNQKEENSKKVSTTLSQK